MPFHKGRRLNLRQARRLAQTERQMAEKEAERKKLVSEINRLQFQRSRLGKFTHGVGRFGKGVGRFAEGSLKGLSKAQSSFRRRSERKGFQGQKTKTLFKRKIRGNKVVFVPIKQKRFGRMKRRQARREFDDGFGFDSFI